MSCRVFRTFLDNIVILKYAFISWRKAIRAANISDSAMRQNLILIITNKLESNVQFSIKSKEIVSFQPISL